MVQSKKAPIYWHECQNIDA